MAYQPNSGTGSGSQSSNSPAGDTTYTKIFVGGLAWETSNETLRRHFDPFGEILEAVVITDKYTGRSKGYGFVTFGDPEAANRACADPSPIIDGRRANCNLASLGRTQPSFSYGRVMSAGSNYRSAHASKGSHFGSSSYHLPVSYVYQSGYPYLPFGYQTYGSEYVYPQGFYGSYGGQHYLQTYGLAGTNNLPYAQMGHPTPEIPGYTTLKGYMMPTSPIVQYGRPAEIIPTIQTPYHIGVTAPPGQAQIINPACPPQFIQSSASYQTEA